VDLNKRAFVTVFLLFFAVLRVFAVQLEDLVSAEHARQLRAGSGELIVRTHFKNTTPVLIPENAELRQIVSNSKTTLNPNMLVESLYLYNKPKSYHTSVDTWDIRQKTGVFNQTLAISTLAGIQYYSASRSEMRTFYEYSRVIDGPNTKNVIADPVFPQPAPLTLYARQIDLTFGDNVYRYDYSVADSTVIFTQENITALSIGIIPVINRGRLRSVLAVFDCGDSILLYALSMVNAVSVSGLRDRISNSFNSRAEAVLKWFSGRLDSELFK